MSANPPLLEHVGQLYPQLYHGEVPVLQRANVVFETDNVRTATGSWSSKGHAHMTSFRIVFIAERPDPSGLQAFDLPLAYFRKEKVNQPILWGANNITAEVWPLETGPEGSQPPFHVKISFPEGGIGTFCPTFLGVLETARSSLYAEGGRRTAPTSEQVNKNLSNAYFDPNDPTVVFVQKKSGPPPNAQKDRLESDYVYARQQDRDGEKYEPL